MKNGWTKGQYSFFRILFGVYLLVHFLQLFPWSNELFSGQGMLSQNPSPWIITIALSLGILSSLFFILGKWSKIAAFYLWGLLVFLFQLNPLISNPSLPFIGWLLLAHLFIPKSGKIPSPIFLSSWIILSLSYTYSGVLKWFSPSWVDGTAFGFLLDNPLVRVNSFRDLLTHLPPFFLSLLTWGALLLETAFAPLALFKKIRPYLWSLMVSMHISLLFLINFADLTLAMLLVHLFVFDPAWIKASTSPKIIFYDGTCGLCHSWVRFVLSEQKTPQFQFAPIHGETYQKLNQKLPDSIALMDQDKLLIKSQAVIAILKSLGGLWKILGLVLSCIPRPLRDLLYDGVAKLRHRLFAKPKDACPLISPELRQLFLP